MTLFEKHVVALLLFSDWLLTGILIMLVKFYTEWRKRKP